MRGRRFQSVRFMRVIFWFHFGKAVVWGGYPPPPWISRIIKLGVNREVIYGLQQLAGKILSPLELRAKICDFSRGHDLHAPRLSHWR